MQTYKGLGTAGKHTTNVKELATRDCEDTRECTYYVGLQVSGEELNTYENGKHMPT